LFGLRRNDLGRDICSALENITQGVHSSIIKLENLTIIGVIPSAFKGRLESPHPPFTKHKRIKFKKIKCLGKGIPYHMGHASIFAGIWKLAGRRARIWTSG
jgi:hypothetical protein